MFHAVLKDHWLRNINSQEFPRAFSLATKEDISIRDFLMSRNLADNFVLSLSPQDLHEIRSMQTRFVDLCMGLRHILH
jgi:hypothetical protein